MATGRNDLCPCGSGLKFKRCCEGKASKRLSKGLLLLIGVLAAIAAVGLIPMFTSATGAKVPAATAGMVGGSSPGSPQPGPAPAGKVWSEEHGHWHDAPTRAMIPLQGGAMQTPAGSPLQVTAQPDYTPAAPSTAAPIQIPQQPTFTPAPQPPGPVPAGKVWSEEHGHWHDLPPQ